MDPVDLRSDTVTHPTEEMYRQMATAPLGDDVFGDDPTVNRLEQVSAARLGKEAAVFVPTGTMANTIAGGTLTQPGDEMLLMEDSHIYLYEAGGSARLWGVHPRQRKENETPKLYNVVKDIGETTNVIEEHPEIAEKLRQRMEEYDSGVKGW